MAISAPVKSVQYTAWSATPSLPPKSSDWGSKLRASFAKLTFTAAGFTSAAAGDISLLRMPAGKVRVLRNMSWVKCPAGTSTSDLDFGNGAYTDANGTAVVLAGASLAGSLDVGGAALSQNFITGSDALVDMVEFDSQSGWDFVCSFDTANSPASGDLLVWVVYMIGN